MSDNKPNITRQRVNAGSMVMGAVAPLVAHESHGSFRPAKAYRLQDCIMGANTWVCLSYARGKCFYGRDTQLIELEGAVTVHQLRRTEAR